MRWLVVLILSIVPAIAAAKPSVAVAPFEGDDDDKVANTVEKALESEASSVIGHKATGKAMSKLNLSGKLDKADKKKLRKRLEVDVIVEGKVDGKEVELRISGKGVKTSRFKVDRGKGAKFRDDLKDQLGKRLSPDKDDEDQEEVAEPTAPPDDEEDEPKKKKKKKKRRDDDDGGGDDEAKPRHLVTQAAIRGNVGAGFARRGLTYGAAGAMQPPSVGTAAPSANIEIEAYPAAMESLKGIAAGFGVYADFDRAFALSIDVPGGGSAPITQQRYSIGVRYRLAFGQSTVALGVGYAARKYEADRSGLGMNQVLDMPDTNYGAIAPNVVARFPATPTIGIFGGAQLELLLKAGDITEDYGFAKTIAFEIAAGADIAFTSRYGMRIAAELHQVGFKFSKPQRGVSSATDRTIGLTASFEVLY
ncbi:MAG: hypothetical protein M4D80_03165 [Myxococcota bacterium]|nr:hypothetical protein [Deltaproteobacteria bacterium]MDQ3334136.1 hypothetical protein [Myxococcota bacterium]